MREAWIDHRVEGNEVGMQIHEILWNRYGLSVGLKRRLRAYGEVYLNGVEGKLNRLVQEGDRIEVCMWPPEDPALPEDLPITVLYEDQDLLILHKPAGQVVHPVRRHPNGTLVNAAAGYLKRQGHPAIIYLLHRLDRETSGVLIMAKNPLAIMKLEEDFSSVRRVYLAIVWGEPENDQGQIRAPICRYPGRTIQRYVGEGGKDAVTHYRVLARYGSGQASLVQLELETGRTHQIRVHMSSIGHPLIGDSLYGGEPLDGMERVALHSHQVVLPHPRTGQVLRFWAPLPDDMRELVRRLRKV